MNLADNFKINAIDYANQGNSIIGIRGSGKTYTATKIAEELSHENIPFIAFDPTGVWQYLRTGINGNAGIPVVVAGGLHADIELNEINAVKIVDAALKEGVSLVIDLKGIATSNKSKWMRIVSECVEFLMSENHKYGLRHIFIEEAAEFIPQRPNQGGALVYSRIESMARMGRNFSLGYTLINQRAEEIAKAVFEISEQVFLHRQAGKNSLKSIGDWLDYRGLEGRKIVDSLPKMESGACWVVNEKEEVFIKVMAKKTFHPNPKEGINTAPKGSSVSDTSLFIERIKQQLTGEEVKPAKKVKLKNEIDMDAILEKKYQDEIAELKRQLAQMDATPSLPVNVAKTGNIDIEDIISEVLRRMPKQAGSVVYEVEPLEVIRQSFLKEAKEKILADVSKLSPDEKKVLKYIETKQNDVTPAEIITKCFFLTPGGTNSAKISNLLKPLKTFDIVEQTAGGRYRRGLLKRIESLMKGHDAKPEEVQNVYNHILAETT